MQFPTRFSDLPEYVFPRLRALLDPHPGGGEALHMSIGEPQHAFPEFVGDIVARNAAGFGRYPPNDGTPELRAAISAWLTRRYGLEPVDPDTAIMALNGTREGLFNACIALCPERKNGGTPAVLLPNPFYQCYGAAALAAGAEPVFVNAPEESGFLPDFSRVPEEILDRTAIAYLCSPSNPQGAVASEEYWTALIDLAEAHDFRIFADECYSEIYRDAPPPGVLQVASAKGADTERVVSFHSLSKRSNLPGLRSGFVCSGPRNIAAVKQLRAYAGAPLPLPLQRAAEAVWADESHVAENRALYQRKFTLSDSVLGNFPGYSPPRAGFFLWLRVGDGEGAALKLWREKGVRVLPGRYLSRTESPALGGGDPGREYIRVALVAGIEDVTRGLNAIADCLGDEMSE
ncbi:MAG: aminotransferase class I/II-fold pyridoxal phosphate-dependent enzyme [Paracoccaceae bacterium]